MRSLYSGIHRQEVAFSIYELLGNSVPFVLGTGNRAPKRVVTVKDAIRTLEREPQMSKSTFMYRLYERSAVAGTQEKK